MPTDSKSLLLINSPSPRRIVIKIGSNLLIDHETSKVNLEWFDHFVEDVIELKEQGHEIILVCSGAIILGKSVLKKVNIDKNLEDKQAASAIGQIELSNLFQTKFMAYKQPIAQVLLSITDTEARRRHLNARATINALIRNDVIPLINENDSVSTAEIRAGDNDLLASHIAQMTSADQLILLSSQTHGLYENNPDKIENAKIIDLICEDSMEILGPFKQKAKNFHPGIYTKIKAAQIAMEAGCTTIFTFGKEPHPLQKLFSDPQKLKTVFTPSDTPYKARQRWISSHLLTSGGIIISETGTKNLADGKGLHPKHILSINGIFQRGELVTISNQLGQEIGRGLSAYCWKDAVRIRGSDGTKIINELGFGGREVMIHPDDLCLVITEIATDS